MNVRERQVNAAVADAGFPACTGRSTPGSTLTGLAGAPVEPLTIVRAVPRRRVAA
jgi:hypothetical protein